MARAALSLALAALLLAGCSGSDPTGPSGDGSEVPDAPSGSGSQNGASDDGEGGPAAAPGEPALGLQECWSIRTSMPVDYSSTQALLPGDLTAASWIGPGDETFAMVDLLAFDCAASTLGEEDTGPASLLFVEVPLEVEGEQSGSNVFPLLVIHDSPAIAGFWDGKWPAQEGTLVRTSGPTGTSTVLAISSGSLAGVLEVQVPDAVGDAIDGSFRQLSGGPEERREVVAKVDGMLVGLGGTAEFTGSGLPVVSADGVPVTASAGIAVANGPLESVTFSAQPAA